jgi:hypothetical protein
MICTKCKQPITSKGYHRTKKGNHHYICPDLGWSAKQRELAAKHGTPAQFAVAVYKTVPEFISMDEARVEIEKYNREWNA